VLCFIARTLVIFGSIAAMALLAPTASADLPMHPSVWSEGPSADDFGGVLDPETPEFGRAVLIRNELAFIGMPFRGPGGRVGVYSATSTTLSRTDTLTPSDPMHFGRFGRSLAFRDGILIIGADRAAYVFQRSNGVWKQRQKLTPPPAADDDTVTFADSLSYEDGTLAIGATGFHVPGAVYIYERNTSGNFVARGKLVATDSLPNDAFGASISRAGRVMVVGAPGRGAAYVFRRNSAGVWRPVQTLMANELGFGGAFGAAVAIDRGMIIVGAPFVGAVDPNDLQGSGAAYGFIANGGVYVETFKLKPEDFRRYTLFGKQIAMFDERVVVGAERDVSSDSFLNGTAVFTYTRAGSSVTPRGLALEGFQSTSLSLANQRVIVGMPCNLTFLCWGQATMYNLNVFQ
jgi:hypothetical protein